MYEEYKQKRQELQKFMDKEDYSKASEIAMEMCEEFPEHCSTYYNLAYVQAMLEQLEDVITTLDTAYDRGAWWLENDFEEFPHYEKLLSSSRFQNIIKKYNERYKDAMKNSRLKWGVRTPPDYDHSSLYPLLIALPYRDSNIEHFEPYWKDKVLGSGAILAILQSSQMVSQDGYTWEDLDLSLRELNQAYSEIKKEYPVDTENVFLAGASVGGMLALHATFVQPQFPVKGAIAVIPHDITAEELIINIEDLVEQGVRCCLVAGTEDRSYKPCKDLVNRMKEYGMKHKFFAPSGVGHVIPHEFDQILDQIMPFLLE